MNLIMVELSKMKSLSIPFINVVIVIMRLKGWIKINCTVCGKKNAKRKFYGKHYCKECYIGELFGCKDIHDYVDKNKIFHLHSAIDKHIILGKRDGNIIEMCGLLDVEYWFGKGEHDDYMHIGVA